MNLAVTVLAGRRPELLRSTLMAWDRLCAVGGDTLRPLAIVHGDDEESAQELDRLGFDVELRGAAGNCENTTDLWRAAANSGAEYLLHLEDDWGAIGDLVRGLKHAEHILSHYADVGQVRMRVAHAKVKQYNAATGDDPVLSVAIPGARIGNWHATLNPTLMRCRDVEELLPFATEPELMMRFARLGWKVAQLEPGVFAHMGGGKSLEGH